MLDTQTIKCPHCGYDTFIKANEPIFLCGNIICPHCGFIIIKTLETYYINEKLIKDIKNE